MMLETSVPMWVVLAIIAGQTALTIALTVLVRER